MRKPIAPPSFEHYLGPIGPADTALVTTLKGHLVVEALLVDLLQLHDKEESWWDLSFPKKTSKCVSLGFLTPAKATALNDLNDLRNDFAHILGQSLSFDRVFRFIQKSADGGFEFSDEAIYQDRAASERDYGVLDGIVEVLNSFYVDLAIDLLERGGPNRTGG